MTTQRPELLLGPNAQWILPDGRPHPEFYKQMLSFIGSVNKVVDFSNIPETPLPTDLRNMYLIGAASDETVSLTTGVQKLTFRCPCDMEGLAVRASLKTAQASGSLFTVDINRNGSSILSTKITIDNGEKTSTTAATAAVLSDTAWGDDDEFTVDIDQVGNGTAVGLKVTLYGVRPSPP